MAVTKKGVTSDWLAWELDGNHRPSRENATVAINQTIEDGQPVSLDASGDIVVFDGTGAVAGIAIGTVKTTAEKGKGVILAHQARIVAEKLKVEANDLATVVAGLKTLGITTVRSA